jgi:hypothetical protein
MKTSTAHHAPFAAAITPGVKSAVIALFLLCAGCGGGGGSTPAAINGIASGSGAGQTQAAANSFTITSDSYGMKSANYLAASTSSIGIILRSAIASGLTDANFRTVSRIDIPTSGVISTAGAYSLCTATGDAPLFPGSVNFFNGDQSTLLKTVGGSIRFTSFGVNAGDRISGSFSVTVEDGNDLAVPRASYFISAKFDFLTGSYGPIVTLLPA